MDTFVDISMDWIHINAIRCYGYTGALPEEQILGQWFEINLSLGLDLHIAGNTDNLTDTLDYRTVIAQVTDLVHQSKYALVEKLASVIASNLLQFPLVQQVKVCLTKVSPPIPNFSGNIFVEIIR